MGEKMVKKILIVLLFFSVSNQLMGGYPGIVWRELRTPHFNIIFPKGREAYAFIVSRVAERAFPIYKQKYGAEHPEKTIITLWDIGEIDNGATFYFWNFIRIDGYRGYFYLRDTTPWWKNVISHEYSHDISLLAATPTNRNILGIFGGINNSNDHGEYAGEIYIPSTNIPRWLAEGIAQYDAIKMGGDRWDSIRDMLLRIKLLSGKNLSNDQLGTIHNKGFINGEMVYNEGLALTIYLEKKFPGIIPRITKKMGHKWYSGFEKAFREETGESWNKFFNGWVSAETTKYIKQIKGIIPLSGSSISPSYQVVRKIYPFKKKLLYIASTNFPPGDLYFGTPRKTTKQIAKKVWAFTVKGNTVLFSSSKMNWKGYSYSKLYLYHKGEITPIPTTTRFYALTSTNSGFAGIGWHNNNMALCLLSLPNFQAHCMPLSIEDVLSITSDGEKIYMVIVKNGKPLLVKYSKGNFYYLKIKGYVREVFYRNKKLFFNWDRNRIYNIYSINTTTNQIYQITNTISGAFYPTITTNEILYYSQFVGDGFQIFKMKIRRFKYIKKARWIPIKLTQVKQNSIKTAPAVNHLLPPVLFPEVVYSFGHIKLGGTILLRDILEKFQLESEYLLGRDIDFSVKTSLNYTIPTFYINFYYYRRSKNYTYELLPLELKRNIYLVETGFKYSYLYPFYFQPYFFYREIKTNYIGVSYTGMKTKEIGLLTAYQNGDNPDSANPQKGLTGILNISIGNSTLPEGPITRKNYFFTTIKGDLFSFIPISIINSSLFFHTEGGYIDRKVETYDYFFLGSWISYLSEGDYNVEESFPGYNIFIAQWYLAQRVGFRIPLWEGAQKRWIYTLNGIYLGLFGDTGIAKRVTYKSEKNNIIKEYTKIFPYDFGIEIRIKSYMFYSNPWNSFIKLAYSPKIHTLRFYIALGIGF